MDRHSNDLLIAKLRKYEKVSPNKKGSRHEREMVAIKRAPEPELWFHDLFRPDGTPFDKAETALIRELAAEK